jgi:nucleotide sugar dehydrogenase
MRESVTVVGLGRMGLPLAVRIAESNCQVTGVDISPQVVDLVGEGIAPFSEEDELEARLANVVSAGRLTTTSELPTAASASDVVIVIVPLVLDTANNPDFSMLDGVTRTMAPALKAETLVSYETTLPLGTTRDRFVPMIEAGSGLKSGENLFVVHSPERVSSGRVFSDLRRYPKLVGGVDDASEARAAEFYARVLDFDVRPELPKANGVWRMGSSEGAELAKLAETTFRDVNIAFANELAVTGEKAGVDVYTVIEACNSQPYSHVHQPGIAVGGHCIPVYPYLYLAGDPEAKLPALGRSVNESIPGHALDLLEENVGSLVGKRVAILGLAFRGDLKSDARSGAWDLVRLLEERGATPLVQDPLWDSAELIELGLEPYTLGNPIDAVVVQTDHDVYRTLCAEDVPGAAVVMDGRNVTSPRNWGSVRRIVLGKGTRTT